MLVSVIMGVYNSKDKNGLERSIRSIINQRYKEWEFIICDDGSSDTTLETLKKYETLDNRIKVVSYEKNQGLANALNTALEEAKGKYIIRQDDDDVSPPERIERLVDFAEHNPQYSIVGSNARVFDANGFWGEFKTKEKPEKKDFLWNSPFIHPSVLMVKDDLMSVGGYRKAKETRRCEDYDLFMTMYAAGYKGYNIQEDLYEYRMDNDRTKKYRPMKYRVDEAVVRFKGYKKLGMLMRGLPYIIKPILIGLLPANALYRIRKKQYK